VSDSLVGYWESREFVSIERNCWPRPGCGTAVRGALSRRAASYLEVLTNETNAFNAELGLAQARVNELVSLFDIYRNLGGGWDP
jgi:hypothetical protein